MKSGFNLLSLKKDEQKEIKKHYYKHVVVGDDLYSLSVLDKLLERKDGPVAWISPRELSSGDLCLQGPTSLRGQNNIDWFVKNYPEIDIEIDNGPALFFKELKWRKFGGRAKSEPLLWSESFYTEPRASLKQESLFTFTKDEERLALVEGSRLDFGVMTVKQTIPDDLAEPAFFNIKTTNGDEVNCEHLYWGESPSIFASRYETLDELNSDFIELCEQTVTPSALYITLSFDKKITEMKETLFVPLSYTHEWGHFIGEIIDEENGKQRAEFVTFLDKNSCTEEDISKKIRLLKRNIEKIFPEFTKISYGEFIKLSDHSFCLNVDDKAFADQLTSMNNLHFVSYNAPVSVNLSDASSCGDSLSPLDSMARGLAATTNTFI
jgi:hypothetical protein